MQGSIRRFGLVVTLFLFVGMPLSALARPQAQTRSFSLGAGQVATITFEAFCIEFGQFFPEAIVAPQGVAPDKVRAALAYIQQQGIAADPAKALDANFAIWQLAGFTRATGGGATTQEVLQHATTPPADPAGTSILDAAQASQVRLTLVSWQAIGDKVPILSATDHFYGRGSLTVENISQQTLQLFMPIGTIFPPGEGRFQAMAGYATDVKLPNLPQTGAADELPLNALALLALAVVGAGWLLARHASARRRGNAA